MIPQLLKVTEIEIEVTIRVRVDVRHTVIAVSILPEMYYTPPITPDATLVAPEFYSASILYAIAYCTDSVIFFRKRAHTFVRLTQQITGAYLLRELDAMKP